jgi:hypothetical protein
MQSAHGRDTLSHRMLRCSHAAGLHLTGCASMATKAWCLLTPQRRPTAPPVSGDGAGTVDTDSPDTRHDHDG